MTGQPVTADTPPGTICRMRSDPHRTARYRLLHVEDSTAIVVGGPAGQHNIRHRPLSDLTHQPKDQPR